MMNLFYLKNNKITCLSLISDKQVNNIKTQGNNYFFYDENDKLVGFNIFEQKHLELFNLPFGRILVNQQILELINKIFNLKLDLNDFSFFKVVKIIDFIKIPNTHLTVCDVLIDQNQNKRIQIVCGAQNVKEQLLTVLAPQGILMDNLLFIKQSKLQKYDSFGMLCSAKELNLNDDFNSNGIIELNETNYHIGDTFLPAYNQKY